MCQEKGSVIPTVLNKLTTAFLANNVYCINDR